MSVSVLVLRQRILDLIGDVDPDAPVVNPMRLNAIINRQTHRIASRTVRPQEAVQSITLVVGTYDYALASSVNVDHVAQVFLNAEGEELCYVPFELFNSRYKQATANPAASGKPQEYTLWETAAQVLTLRVGPTPDSAADGPLKVYHSVLPTVVSNSAYQELDDVTTIPFGDELAAGLEAACAAEAVMGLSQEALAMLKLDRSIVNKWEAETEQAIRAYNMRQNKNGRRQDSVLRTSSNRLAGWFARS